MTSNYFKDILNKNVSIYNNARSFTPTGEMSFNNLLENIKNGTWKIQVDNLRNLNDSEYQKQKVNMSAVTFSSTQHHRKKWKNKKEELEFLWWEKIKEYNSIIQIDIDKINNNAELLKLKNEIANDKHIAFIFNSLSNKGLKAGFLISNFKAEQHADSDQKNQMYEIVKNYFIEKYNTEIDKAVKDLFRLCFISYDPDLRKNEKVAPFRIELNQKNTSSASTPQTQVEIEDKNNQKALEIVQKWIDEVSYELRTAPDGERHLKRFGLGSKIGMLIAGGYLSESAKDDFDNDIRSNTKNFENAKKNFLNGIQEGKKKPFKFTQNIQANNSSKKKTTVSKPKNANFTDTFTENTAKVSTEKIESNLPFCFWSESISIDTKTGQITPKLKINQRKLYKYLSEYGFFKGKIDKIESDYELFYHKNKLLEKKTEAEVRNLITNDNLKLLPKMVGEYTSKLDLQEKLITGINSYVSPAKLDSLNFVNMKIKRDEIDKSFIYFKNGFVEITKDSVVLKDYKELDGLIWKDKIINKNIDIIDSDLERTEILTQHHFYEFMELVCSYRNIENSNEITLDEDRFRALFQTIGYLVHNYSKPNEQKAVIITEDNLDDTAEGRAGKSLLVEAIGRYGKIRKVSTIDGKSLDLSKSFAFQSVDRDTDVVFIDDAVKNLPFEKFFSMITQGFEVEKKNKDKFKFEPEVSPKIVFTTNYPLKGDSGSHRARKHNMEVLSFFSNDYTPIDHFGKYMFIDWNQDDWNLFYNIIFWAVQQYFKAGTLKEYESNTLRQKQIITDVGRDLYEFLEDYNIDSGYIVVNDFIDKFSKSNYKLTPRSFYTKLHKYCSFKNYSMERKKARINITDSPVAVVTILK